MVFLVKNKQSLENFNYLKKEGKSLQVLEFVENLPEIRQFVVAEIEKYSLPIDLNKFSLHIESLKGEGLKEGIKKYLWEHHDTQDLEECKVQCGKEEIKPLIFQSVREILIDCIGKDVAECNEKKLNDLVKYLKEHQAYQ